MSRLLQMALVLSVSVWVAGCGNDRPALPVYSLDGLKRDLGSIAQTGDGGSALEGIKYSIEKLAGEKFEGAEELKKQFSRLEKAGNAENRKQIAGEMLKIVETPKPAA